MNSLTDLCCLCLVNGNTVTSILLQDNDGIVVKNKLDYVFSEVVNLKFELFQYNICIDCLNALNYVYKFKRECLQNLISLNINIENPQEYKEFDQPGRKQDQIPSASGIQHDRADRNEMIQRIKYPSSQNEEQKCTMSNAECTVKTENRQELMHEVPENNEEILIVKQELEYKDDEMEIKYDPLLLDGDSEENSRDNLSSEPTNNTEDILDEPNETTFHTLPKKSKARYLKEMEKFRQWMKSRNVQIVTEKVVVAYFNSLIDKYAPPSLWSTYSMLRSTLFVFEKIDISRFKTLFAILKNKSKGYEPKKAKTFQQKHLETFMTDAPDEVFLLMKVAVLFGVMGACRCDELVNLKTTDIDDKGSVLVIKILKTKNYKSRSFVVTDDDGPTGYNGIQLYRKYAALRPSALGAGRFFLNYRSGKCTVHPVGINTLAKIPKLVANYLKLSDAHLYTGHCFRRTSATFLASAFYDINTKRMEVMMTPGPVKNP